MKKTISLFFGLALVVGGCTVKDNAKKMAGTDKNMQAAASGKFLKEATMACNSPKGSFNVELGFKDQAQKDAHHLTTKDGQKLRRVGFPVVRVVQGGKITPLPTKGLVGDVMGPVSPPQGAEACKGGTGIASKDGKVWLVFTQGAKNKLIFLTYDPAEKKMTSGQAIPGDVYGILYNQGNFYYQTSLPPTQRAIPLEDGDKKVPLQERTLAYWVKLDLHGRTPASIDDGVTFQTSAYKPLFKDKGSFDRFFGRNDKGVYTKPWVYVGKLGKKTCAVAFQQRYNQKKSVKKDQMTCI